MVLINGIKGFLTGVALVVPGLSGSIFAVALGIYEKILDAVNNFGNDINGHLKFLLPLAAGAALGVLASAKAILWFCVEYPVWSYLFFVGLVLGSLPLVFKKMSAVRYKPLYLFITLACFLGILYLSAIGGGESGVYIALEALERPMDALIMAWAGFFSVSLMTLPGVSGSVMLMVAGHYGTVYNAVSKALDLMASIISGNWETAGEALSSVVLILPFGLGAFIGIIIMAKIMGYLLKKWEPLVYYGVFGVISGAVVTLIHTGVIENLQNQSVGPAGFVACAAFAGAGFLCTGLLSK